MEIAFIIILTFYFYFIVQNKNTYNPIPVVVVQCHHNECVRTAFQKGTD